MSVTFTKLFSSITESTVWCEPDRVRLVWITMLAMADKHGRVWASIPGLANRARVPVEDARAAIARFLEPDEDSRTSDHDGRRIEPIDGGWRLLNYAKYRGVRDEEDRREYQRVKKQESRQRLSTMSTEVNTNSHNAEAEAEAELKNKNKNTSPLAPPLPFGSGVSSLDSEQSKPPPGDDEPNVQVVKNVFEYYLQKTGRRVKQYALTSKRLKAGLRAYKECKRRFPDDDHAEQAMALAVKGLTEDSWNKGENPKKKKYLDWIDHLFKDTEMMEQRWEAAGGMNV